MPRDRCHIHDEQPRPCSKCARIFALARRQVAEQRKVEARAAHAVYLKRGRSCIAEGVSASITD